MLRFNGATYDWRYDNARLTRQYYRIFRLMKDSKWRTLTEISWYTGDPPASISAQLRHMRKERFGSHTVNKRVHGDRYNGLYEYQLVPRPIEPPALLFEVVIHEDRRSHPDPL